MVYNYINFLREQLGPAPPRKYPRVTYVAVPFVLQFNNHRNHLQALYYRFQNVSRSVHLLQDYQRCALSTNGSKCCTNAYSFGHVGDIPSFKLFESPHLLAFLDIQPLSRGHAVRLSPPPLSRPPCFYGSTCEQRGASSVPRFPEMRVGASTMSGRI